ncbi:hypothetical protein EST38_g6691 [Candolleomyces aberdarensis]|uniref:Beta-lactamase-related domain-containing protein n=1 Tax=Candolleomyces aberdarensis TaxID=2316362 RepID=A0A4Q2DKD6_9AGAR|nr:hypothetical protein EST38_g6691 [Candolleomyces aberdarensis]
MSDGALGLLALFSLPSSDHLAWKAAESLRKHFSARTSQADIDSLAIAVVTPAGVVFEEGYGILKANDTSGKQYLVDENSIYRIASVTKVFTVFETLLLRERGLLVFDDPVEKYIPEFSPPSPSYGWSDYLSDRSKDHAELGKHRKKSSRITLRQLASHTAGFAMLGLANVDANLKAVKHRGLGSQSKTHKELVKRDIFDAFGLNRSFYRVPEDEELKAHIAIPAQNSDWADFVLGDIEDGAGGQYSSLSDLAKFTHLLLSPNPPKDYAFLPSLVREWLRPLHIWPDGTEAVGAPWEIDYLYLPPWYQKQPRLPIYWKMGNLPGYHSAIGLNQEYGYGVVILVTGKYGNTRELGRQALNILQPAFRKVLEDQVREAYTGEWEVVSGGNSTGTAFVGLSYGQLVMARLVVDGVDVLRAVQEANTDGPFPFPNAVPLWSTGRIDEFRLAFGRGGGISGCLPYWASVDPGLTSRGASIDLVYWEKGELVYPSAGVRFKRKRQY